MAEGSGFCIYRPNRRILSLVGAKGMLLGLSIFLGMANDQNSNELGHASSDI